MKHDPPQEIKPCNDKKAIVQFTNYITQKQSDPNGQNKKEHGNHHNDA